jgi:hypothetical protein
MGSIRGRSSTLSSRVIFWEAKPQGLPTAAVILSGDFVTHSIYGNWFFFNMFSASPGGKMPLSTLCFQSVLSFVFNVAFARFADMMSR